MKSVAILGGGLSGVFASAAFWEVGIDEIYIYSKTAPFPLIPYGVTIHNIPKCIDFIDPEPVWNLWEGDKSVEKYLEKRFRHWNYQQTHGNSHIYPDVNFFYNPMFSYATILSIVQPTWIQTSISESEIAELANRFTWVIQTFPSEIHRDLYAKNLFKIWAKIFPWEVNDKNYYKYNTTDQCPWYRESWLFGYRLVEYPFGFVPSGEELSQYRWIHLPNLIPGTIPVPMQHPIYRNVWLVGRWARWDSNMTVDQVYEEIRRLL